MMNVAEYVAAGTSEADKLARLENCAIELSSAIKTGTIEKADAVDALLESAREHGLVSYAGGEEAIEHLIGWGLEGRSARGDGLAEFAGKPSKVSRQQKVSADNFDDFLKRKIPPRQTLLSPWLPEQGLAMIHAPRGIGKTHVAMGTCWAVATGGGFLRWQAGSGARRVLLLDGEMPGTVLQDRLKGVVERSGLEPPMPDYLKLAAADLAPDGLPDISNEASAQFYADVIADADLVVVDNVSTLCPSVKENDADSWVGMQSWCLSQRRAGKSVLLIHHAGKSGQQRGSSRKEDVLDTVIGLRRPPDYQADQGARFEIHFEKTRGFFGPEAESFEARLIGRQWQESAIRSGDDLETLKALHKAGLTVRDIAERTGLGKSTVARRLQLEDAG
jgi:hypothetical protein